MRYLDRINDPDATPLAWLNEHLPSATAFTACVGYLDRAGVQLVEAELRALLDRGGSVRLIVDARDDRPRRADVAWILELLAAYGDRAALHLARDVDALHAKVFHLTATDGHRALIGSANFTRAGLTKNWEAAIALEPGDTTALTEVQAALDAWQAHAGTATVDQGTLLNLGDERKPTGESLYIADMMQDHLDLIAADPTVIRGVRTGFDALDRLLCGLQEGQLVLVAGRPGVGKSTLATDFARNASVRADVPVLVLSFEMDKAELMMRVLSAEARVPLHVLRSRLLTDDDWTKLARRMGELSEAPLMINDSCTPSIRNLSAEARRAVAEDGVKLIIIDYIQLLHLDRRAENRQQETAEISRMLKRLARELNVPIVAVSQLSRANEMRTDKRPQLSDLRDSGGLEQDADIVIFVHRDDYYDKESRRAGEADLIVAKHRNGPTDTVVTAAQLHLSRFVDMAIY